MAAACGGDDGSTGTNPFPFEGSDASTTLPLTSSTDAATATTQPTDAAPAADLSPDAVTTVDEGATAGQVRSLVRTVEVGSLVHYAGFDVTIEQVLFGFDPAGFAVAEVRASLFNDTPREDRLQTAIEIESARFVAVIDRDETPAVAPGSSASGWWSLRLDPSSFTFDDAVLYVGRPDRQRAVVPLGSAGELATLEPVEVAAQATAEGGGSTVSLGVVVLAWDQADPRGQASPGEMFLTVEYTLEAGANTAVNDDTIVLVAPDGNLLTPDSASVEQVGAAVATPLTATFVVGEPAEGDYVLRYIERFDRGEVEVPFSVTTV